MYFACPRPPFGVLPTSLHVHLVRCSTDSFHDLLLCHTQIEQSGSLRPEFYFDRNLAASDAQLKYGLTCFCKIRGAPLLRSKSETFAPRPGPRPPHATANDPCGSLMERS